MRTPLVLLLLCAGAASGGCEHDPRPATAEELRAGLGLPEAFFTSAAEVLLEDGCAGPAVVVPETSEVRVELPRGMHTLRGRFSACGASASDTVGFAVRRLGSESALLDTALGERELSARRVFPFTVTFFVPRDGATLVLQTRGPASARTAWGDLRLFRRSVPSLAAPRREVWTPTRSTLFPPDQDGRRARASELSANEAGAYWLTDWGWEAAHGGFGPVEIDRANGDWTPNDGDPMTVAGQRFERGVGAHAPASIWVHLSMRCTRFTASVGVDDSTGPAASVIVRIFGDEDELFESEVLRRQQRAIPVDIELTGRDWLRIDLDPSEAGNYDDAADLGDAQIFCD